MYDCIVPVHAHWEPSPWFRRLHDKMIRMPLVVGVGNVNPPPVEFCWHAKHMPPRFSCLCPQRVAHFALEQTNMEDFLYCSPLIVSIEHAYLEVERFR